MRDLSVYETSGEGVLTYEEMYEYIKSIEITNKGLKPSIGYKLNQKQETKQNKQVKFAEKQKKEE